MASENETLADIIAEVRRNAESSQMGHKSFLAPSAEYWKSLANRIDAAWSRVRGIVAELAIAVRECKGEKYHVTLLRDADAIASGETPNCPSLVQKQGGGLDNSPGNAAAMREALENAHSLICEGIETEVDDEIEHPFHLELACECIQRAISAPPRNCDAGTPAEQSIGYEKFCFEHRTMERCCQDCPIKDEPCCELAWAQMPYAAEEGGAK